MPRNNEKAVRGSEKALDRFKWEIAEELGLSDKVHEVGWENMTTREVGHIGGQMVKRMIEKAEESLIKREAQRLGSPGNAPSTLSPQRLNMLDHLYDEQPETPALSEVQKQVAWGDGTQPEELTEDS